MENKIALADLLKVKQTVDQMDLLEFKNQWNNRSDDYAHLQADERLKYMVMSIKVLQAKADLKRMIHSIKDLASHPESEKAIYYYLRADLWKLLDNFRYILLVEDLEEQERFECLDMLDDLSEIIVQDEELLDSCLLRLHRLIKQLRLLKRDLKIHRPESAMLPVYEQLEHRMTQILHNLEPSTQIEEPVQLDLVSEGVLELLQKYTSFSVARISIEKSGVLSIIQLLADYPVEPLEADRDVVQQALETLDKQVLYTPALRGSRNQSAYALIVILEILKMHKGLPVLLSRIFDLCSYVHFPADAHSLEAELKVVKGRVSEISQKKLRPIIEDLLWKNPTFLTKLPYLRSLYPWCYRADREDVLNIARIRQVVTSSFDRLEAVPGIQFTHEGVAKSRLSEMVIESLGLLVNLEPSPRFLKLHAEESQTIKKAKKSGHASPESIEKLLNKQYQTYKGHLKFLQDSLEYYQGISEELGLPSTSP